MFAALLCGCSDIEAPAPAPTDVPDGTPVTIITGTEFPEMLFHTPASRAMNDEPTVDDLRNNLKVNLFVFDPSGVMLQFIGPEDISIVRIDEANKQVYFKVSNIYSSSRPRVLHFVVTSADDLHAISGGEYITAMAGETTTMPALVVENGIDAYWGIHQLNAITSDMTLHVKLIRNFVKINVRSSAPTSVFRLLGYTIVNRPSMGTVTPYIYSDHLFAAFLNPENVLLSYDEIIAQGYYGVNPAGSDNRMTFTTEPEVRQALEESEALLAAGEDDTPCYIYERSQSAITSAGSDVMVTYAIIVGEYEGRRTYYKIDIGRDKDGRFGFYDLLRNFQYTIDITEVGGEGAPTLIDAMNGAAHNNLSTSVVTRDLFSIGYEGEKIEVSATRVIFTERTVDYEFRFRYTTPSGMAFDASKLKVYNLADETVEYDMGGVRTGTDKAIDLAGEVIESASLTMDANGWYVMKVSCKDVPTDSRRYEQNVRIYYRGGNVGLGRTVTFMLRRPWEFGNVTATAPGSGIKSAFDITFTIPSGLARALFPLIITFESDKQNIYGLNGSDLTVTTGRSNFAGGTTDTVISYEWRLEWADYSPADGVEGGTFTARFMTNTLGTDDAAYNTSAIDNASNGSRIANNGTRRFCIRMANKGLKYLQPVYVNITRN